VLVNAISWPLIVPNFLCCTGESVLPVSFTWPACDWPGSLFKVQVRTLVNFSVQKLLYTYRRFQVYFWICTTTHIRYVLGQLQKLYEANSTNESAIPRPPVQKLGWCIGMKRICFNGQLDLERAVPVVSPLTCGERKSKLDCTAINGNHKSCKRRWWEDKCDLENGGMVLDRNCRSVINATKPSTFLPF
jgi:hypothetical protein